PPACACGARAAAATWPSTRATPAKFVCTPTALPGQQRGSGGLSCLRSHVDRELVKPFESLWVTSELKSEARNPKQIEKLERKVLKTLRHPGMLRALLEFDDWFLFRISGFRFSFVVLCSKACEFSWSRTTRRSLLSLSTVSSKAVLPLITPPMAKKPFLACKRSPMTRQWLI